MAAYLLRLYQRAPGAGEPPRLVEERILAADTDGAAIAAAEECAKSAGKDADYGRLRAPDHSVLWCADSPFA